MLKKQLNPIKESDKLTKWFPFDKGDKIMCIKNDRENEVMNGESGRISDEDKTTFSVYYRDLDKTVCYKKNSETVKNFQLAYCSTIHKLQGSEFKYIVIIMNQDSPFMDSRILYTGITRGKQTVIYLSNKQTTEKVVARNNREKRNTFLKERMISEFKEDIR
jgi:exodeoxyribonuclease V alpha subunit